MPSRSSLVAVCLAAVAFAEGETMCTIDRAVAALEDAAQFRPDCLPAKFGSTGEKVAGDLVLAEPFDGCTAKAEGSLAGRVVLATRGVCGFAAKAENAQKAGDPS